MKIERFGVKTCCGGKPSLVLKLSSSVSKDFIPLFVGSGYTEAKRFTEGGMLYVESVNLIATGVFGSDNLQIKCKVKDCDKFISAFEELLATME